MTGGARGRLLVVDGLDGSGKTQFATRLAGACAAEGLRATIVHVDDYRRDLDFSDRDAASEGELYYRQYYDFEACDAAVRAALTASDSRCDVVILEGVFTLRIPIVAEAGVLVALDISRDEARRRIADRDRRKGRSEDEIGRRIDRRYFPGNTRYEAEHSPSSRAALVIDNHDWMRPRIVREAGPGPLGESSPRLVEIVRGLVTRGYGTS